MEIEREVFRKKQLLPERLVPYGFVPDGTAYVYVEPILDGQMRAEVRVAPDGAVWGRVVDAATEDEYAPLRVEWSVGAFVGAVREAYRAVLQRIADACCVPLYFVSAQANRLAAAIAEAWHEAPDFPFATAPDYGVFRCPANRKWYGLIMNIRRHLLDRSQPRQADGPMVDVLNIKIDPARHDQLLATEGVYPCYHMNRANWISIVLDDTLPDAAIMDLIAQSRALVSPKARR